ncbi:MAG: hypothetical protein A2Z65_13600 [Gallionellales bacterium RIFCSPLOWO2_02_58_13]|nr:MAG: hypothetical protein A2Z65_13600 [Gallionellales bacterium RIFCSPLOWO2_02_58_13]
MSEPVEAKNPELDALTAEAAAVDMANAPQVAGTGPGAEVQAVAHGVDRLGEAAMLLGIARPLLVLLVPYIKDAPEPEWQALQEPIAGLLGHYSVDVGAWLNSPWAKLGAAAIPLAMRGVMAWNAAEKEKPVPGIGADTAQVVAAVAGEPEAAPIFAARG